MRKIEDNWKGRVQMSLPTSLPRSHIGPWSKWMNLEQGTSLRPYRRESSQHQQFELNQPTSVPPLHISSIGHVLAVFKASTQSRTSLRRSTTLRSAAHICLIRHQSVGPRNSKARSLINLRNHVTKGFRQKWRPLCFGLVRVDN